MSKEARDGGLTDQVQSIKERFEASQRYPELLKDLGELRRLSPDEVVDDFRKSYPELSQEIDLQVLERR